MDVKSKPFQFINFWVFLYVALKILKFQFVIFQSEDVCVGGGWVGGWVGGCY